MDAVAVLSSGGLDSCALIAELAKDSTVYPLYMNAGLTWEKEERAALEAFLRAASLPTVQSVQELAVPVTTLYGEHFSVTGKGVPGYDMPDEAVYLPGRNILLISLAAVWCSLHDVHRIAIGSLDHNPFPDASPAFFQALAGVLSQGLGYRIEVVAPFRSLEKSQVIREHNDLPLEFSVSCKAPKGSVHCGACIKCRERQEAFAQAGVLDRTHYAHL